MFQGCASVGNLRQPGGGVFEVAQEFLVGVDGLGFLAVPFQELAQVKLRQHVREKVGGINQDNYPRQVGLLMANCR